MPAPDKFFPVTDHYFFAADMKAKIEKLKNEGLSNYGERGKASVVLTNPEQQNINLFQLGM